MTREIKEVVSPTRRLDPNEMHKMNSVCGPIINRLQEFSPSYAVNCVSFIVTALFCEASIKNGMTRLDIFDKWAASARASIEATEKQNEAMRQEAGQ